MKQRTLITCVCAGVAALAFAANATSQDVGGMKGLTNGNLGSLAAGSAGNAAGILQYCIQNNYLSGDAASSMKDRLLGKIGGADAAAQDSGYAAGLQGMLTDKDGQSMDITKMGSLESNLTQKACQAVLSNASSLL